MGVQCVRVRVLAEQLDEGKEDLGRSQEVGSSTMLALCCVACWQLCGSHQEVPARPTVTCSAPALLRLSPPPTGHLSGVCRGAV